MRVLIIKLGALGDVIRTTPLLRALKGHEVTWITESEALPLLEGCPLIHRLVATDAPGHILEGRYDLILNLEDDWYLGLVTNYAASPHARVIGPGGAHAWFDMSLSSRFGSERANALKFANRRTYQEMLFEMAGLEFNGEEPWCPFPLDEAISGLIGVEHRTGDKWPSKRWNRFEELSDRLECAGYEVRWLGLRGHVYEYVQDIAECEVVISGDTLAMHLGIALQKPTVALFTCTSPWEVEGYGRLAKVISPKLEAHFYEREYSAEPGDAISVDNVMEAFRGLLPAR